MEQPLAWLIERGPVMLPIPGMSNVAHLVENVAAAGIRLGDEEFVALAGAGIGGRSRASRRRAETASAKDFVVVTRTKRCSPATSNLSSGRVDMRIAIIGTGKVGLALARGLRGKRHQITLGARDPDRVAKLAVDAGAGVAHPEEAAAGAEVVILALPWPPAETAVKALGDLSGKIVIDCMNPVGMINGKLGLTVGYHSSGGEMVAEWAPGARVVKTLNQVGAELMADNSGLPHRPVMFMAGDDAAAKAAVTTLLTDLGFEALDAGELEKARILEPFALVWINQALLRGKGRNWAFAAVEGS
jgi:predicted dinucleotide-binding enzyme